MSARSARHGTFAAASNHKNSASYTFASQGLPSGMIDVALTSGAGTPALVSSGVLTEPNSTATNGTYYSTTVFPDVMVTNLFSVSMTNAYRNSSNRGNGVGAFAADGSKGVFFVMCGNSTAARIYTWSASTATTQATQSIYSTSASDVLTLMPSLSSGIYTWTVYKNGTATALTWTDSSTVVGLPGQHGGAAFLHLYSSGQYVSPGISVFSVKDL